MCFCGGYVITATTTPHVQKLQVSQLSCGGILPSSFSIPHIDNCYKKIFDIIFVNIRNKVEAFFFFFLTCQVTWCIRPSLLMREPLSLLLETSDLCSGLAHQRPSLLWKWEKRKYTNCWLFSTSTMSARECQLSVCSFCSLLHGFSGF